MRVVKILLLLTLASCQGKTNFSLPAKNDYLSGVKSELIKQWPNNKTINLVFHGHSVPCGYFKTPVVNTLKSYPYQLLSILKDKYPYAVINVINTAIGGENSVSGAKRFDSDILSHKPDVLFIDYALNDLPIGLDESEKAWRVMIEEALKLHIKVILLTPSPNQDINILDQNTDLAKHAQQIRVLSQEYSIGLVDSYELFRQLVISGANISDYMAQVNHPNERGHELIAKEMMKLFE